MVRYPIHFLEGYTEVSKETNRRGGEIVSLKKDGSDYTMKAGISYGVRNGKATIVNGDGTIVESLWYEDGHLNGVCKHHYNNGMVRMECMVVNDVMEGEFTEYDETGNVICSGKYVKGRRIENETEKKRERRKEKKDSNSSETPLIDPEDEDDPNDESQSSSGLGTAAAAGATAAVATGAATGATGAAAALLGFGSPGIAAGSWAASMMSTAWTSGIGTGLVSAAQSAGALFMNAVGGSVLAAGAAVAAPIAVGAAVAGGIYYYKNRKNRMDNQQ